VADAPRVYRALLERGIIVRPIAGYGLPEHLRVTVGLPEHNARFLEALEAVIGKG
jgi:histidinol-phosphate aminotransferase